MQTRPCISLKLLTPTGTILARVNEPIRTLLTLTNAARGSAGREKRRRGRERGGGGEKEGGWEGGREGMRESQTD